MNINLSMLLQFVLWLVCYIGYEAQADIYEKVLKDLGADWDDPRDPIERIRKANKIKEDSGSPGHPISSDNGRKRKREGNRDEFPDASGKTTGSKGEDVAEEKGGSASSADNIQLTKCQSKLQSALKKQNNCLSKVHPDESISYFKQLMRSFSDTLKPLPHDPDTLVAKVILQKEQYEELQSILKKPSSAKEIVDLLDHYNVFQTFDPTPSIFMKAFSYLNVQFMVMVLAGVVAAIVTLLISGLVLKRLFFNEISWRRQLIFIIFISFLFSVPWEWYRMYRVALSKKATMSQDIPDECHPKGLSVWKSVSLYFRNTFSFTDNECIKYQESLLVDPIWEVSPLQATSVCLSRFFIEPMKYFAAALGESFRLFFKEIPAQWQPFLFIAMIVIIIFLIVSCSGLRVETPLLKINVNPKPELRYLPAPAPQEVQQNHQLEYKDDRQRERVRGADAPDDDRVERPPEIRRRKPKRVEYMNGEEEDGEIVDVSGGMLMNEPPTSRGPVELDSSPVQECENPHDVKLDTVMRKNVMHCEPQEIEEIGIDRKPSESDDNSVQPHSNSNRPPDGVSLSQSRRTNHNTMNTMSPPQPGMFSVRPDTRKLPGTNKPAIENADNNRTNTLGHIHMRESSVNPVNNGRDMCKPPQMGETSEQNYFSDRGNIHGSQLRESSKQNSLGDRTDTYRYPQVGESSFERPDNERREFHRHPRESAGSLVVPDASSVFTMPLGMDNSIAEITGTPEMVCEISETSASDTLPETVGAGGLSVDDGYLIVDK